MSSLRSVSVLVLLAALGGVAGVHCGSAEPTIERIEGVAPPPSASVTASGGNTTPDSGRPPGKQDPPDADVLSTDAFPPPQETVPPDGVLLVHAHATFPAFRICPAVSEPGVKRGQGGMLPFPSTITPGASVAGLDAQGAVKIGVDPDPASPSAMLIRDAKEVVLIRINETTKAWGPLATGTCASVACARSEGPHCVGDTHLVRVPLPSAGLLQKKGTIVTLTGSDDATLTFSERPALSAGPAATGAFKVDLVNASNHTAAVQFVQGGTTTLINARGLTDVPFSGYGGSFRAGAYSATLLEIHQSSAPRVAVTDHYGSQGVLALVLVGSPASAERPLKFLAIPMSAR